MTVRIRCGRATTQRHASIGCRADRRDVKHHHEIHRVSGVNSRSIASREISSFGIRFSRVRRRVHLAFGTSG
jgi:hypothetical protein